MFSVNLWRISHRIGDYGITRVKIKMKKAKNTVEKSKMDPRLRGDKGAEGKESRGFVWIPAFAGTRGAGAEGKRRLNIGYRTPTDTSGASKEHRMMKCVRGPDPSIASACGGLHSG
jgi:hypothetical protein